jgi:hypothetical protein
MTRPTRLELVLTPAATFALLVAILVGSCATHLTYQRSDRIDIEHRHDRPADAPPHPKELEAP